MPHHFGSNRQRSPRNSSRRQTASAVFASAVETAREIIEDKLPVTDTVTEPDMQTRRHPAAAASTASTVTDTAKENPAAATTPGSPAAPSSRLSGGDMASKVANQPEVQQALQQTQDFVSTAQAKLTSPEARNWLAKKQKFAQRFVSDLLNQPPAQRVLVAALLITNAILPLFFLHTPEGRAVFFTYLAVSALSLSIYERRGKIDANLALAHLPWLPLIAYLAQNIHGYQTATEIRELSTGAVLTVSLIMHRSAFFTHWLRSVILVNSIALLTSLGSTTKTLLDEAPAVGSVATNGTAKSPRKSKKGLRSKAELHEASEPAGKIVQGQAIKGV